MSWNRLKEKSKSFQGVKLRPSLCSAVKRCQSSKKTLFQAFICVCFKKRPQSTRCGGVTQVEAYPTVFENIFADICPTHASRKFHKEATKVVLFSSGHVIYIFQEFQMNPTSCLSPRLCGFRHFPRPLDKNLTRNVELLHRTISKADLNN